MISFGPMSITLLLCAGQGLVLAFLLLCARRNKTANRFLALLITAVAALITPYIIGYAGFYDKWPWLSFAPFSYTLAFGPLIYFYALSLMDRLPTRRWPHFLPVLFQFLADAIVFPLPLATKNWWDGFAHAPVISPMLEFATLISMAAYGIAALRRYRLYRQWLADNRTDGVDFDPSWIRNFLIALALVALIWLGFMAANLINPARNYFDQFLLYVVFSLLVIYLGIAGWRHGETPFPAFRMEPEKPGRSDVEKPVMERDWTGRGKNWLREIDEAEYWRDPELTLTSLARRLGTNTAYLSRALNESARENFNAIINRRRVAAIQQWLSSPDEARDLMTLAFEAGFSSKASFNRAFADFAGMSPSAWRLKSQKQRALESV
ncbi:helix-turn-helix domain-containing protein [Sphingorhabdus sp. IMCC26285]|jgi:AraC-like DNA-binding protein|uniref:Helix-turn-helix domain-containing protein n=2 Tax=Sphingorhabdus profundilacus TaxID=2509718 RepID=A0A6I4LRV3_9SPHN|nr:helix-turn-helix domain-containing protein [Sphingorhabdus profundilacus]